MNLEVGNAYTNSLGTFAREILAIEKGDISYREFNLDDGQPFTSYRVCQRGTFRRWVARPCTSKEIARFRRDIIPSSDHVLIELSSTTMNTMS